MTLKVIGAGFGRTGTLSLKLALERLGFDRCYHMFEILQNPSHVETWRRAHAGQAIDWDALFDGYQASCDWPSCNLWEEQRAQYPEAKVVLSLRDSQRWYDSVMHTIYPTALREFEADDEQRRAFGQWAMDIIWQPLFGGRMDDRAHVIDVYERHNARVIERVPPDELLVFEAGDGWEPLCRFLEVDVPDEPYPHTNTREQFKLAREL